MAGSATTEGAKEKIFRRRHGFQAPYDTLQIIAWVMVIVFIAEYYILIVAPMPSIEGLLISGIVGSLLICAYVFLAVRVTYSDPSDPHIMAPKAKKDTNDKDISIEMKDKGTVKHSVSMKKYRVDASADDGDGDVETLYYCQYCDKQVYPGSKHCRACNRCVNNFDHHCKWLNNCIGTKNYVIFFTYVCVTIALASCQVIFGTLSITTIYTGSPWGINLKSSVYALLGLDFVSYTVAVAVFVALSVIVIGNTSLLLVFHIKLRLRGITTYEYIIEKRKAAQEAAIAEQNDLFKKESQNQSQNQDQDGDREKGGEGEGEPRRRGREQRAGAGDSDRKFCGRVVRLIRPHGKSGVYKVEQKEKVSVDGNEEEKEEEEENITVTNPPVAASQSRSHPHTDTIHRFHHASASANAEIVPSQRKSDSDSKSKSRTAVGSTQSLSAMNMIDDGDGDIDNDDSDGAAGVGLGLGGGITSSSMRVAVLPGSVDAGTDTDAELSS